MADPYTHLYREVMNRHFANFVLTCLLALIVLLALVVVGPLFPLQPKTYEFQLPTDLDTYLAQGETQIGTVKPDQDKRIFWANPIQQKTPIAIVYLHGFSASRGELSPVPEEIAKALGANLFMTRLKGHGLTNGAEALGSVTAQDFIEDAEEAMAIGRKLGEKVVLVGMSTGAVLALHLGSRHPDVHAIVSINANFQPKDWRAKYLSGPFGPWLARLAIGEYREFKTENAEHAEFWTPRYRSAGVVALMDLLNYVDRISLDRLKPPVLTIYTNQDEVVDVALIKEKSARIKSLGSRVVDGSAIYKRHALAGRILSPEGNAPLQAEIVEFLKSLEPKSR